MMSAPVAPKSGPPSKDGPDPDEVERVAALRRDSRVVAAYVAHMAAEMAIMSRAAGHDLLAYFLDMARIEARIQAGQNDETAQS